MKHKHLYRSFGLIRPQYILEADDARLMKIPRKKKRGPRVVLVILLILVLVAFLVPLLLPDAADSGAAAVSAVEAAEAKDCSVSG